MAADGRFDVIVVGGGTGGVAAAIAACAMGRKVALTEEFAWLGGQLTSQIVPPDEHPWIESFGCTRRYRAYRNTVRKLCRELLPLTPEARSNPRLNPGSGWVSRLCADPRISWLAIQHMLQPHLALGRLKLFDRSIPIAADVDGDVIRTVTFRQLESGDIFELEGGIFIDATETGDLLPLAEAEYVCGAESKADTGEAHALDGPADPRMMQGITWCAALSHDEGSHRVIDRPANYEKWRDCRPSNWPTRLFDFTITNPITGSTRELPLFPKSPDQWATLFTYRQIADPSICAPGSGMLPATIVNWPQNDYYLKPVVDVPEHERQLALAESRDLTQCLLYWLQTDAPRHDGGTGYPGLFFDSAYTGTTDGLAQAPYIRESRRIKAMFRVTETMVSPHDNPGLLKVPDLPRPLGLTAYRMDIHPCTDEGPTIDLGALPCQIPAGALIPQRMTNLLAGAKNIGTTHVSNGCFRLHPAEWNIGESAGLLAAFCLDQGVPPAAVLPSDQLWGDFDQVLQAQGIETAWPALKPL